MKEKKSVAMRRKKLGTIFMILGVLLLAASLLLVLYNIKENQRAGAAADRIMEQWEDETDDGQPKEEGSTPDYLLDPDMDMPVKEVDGVVCVGTIEIPALGIRLPIINEWSYPNLRIAPCRFSGSVYSKDLVIAAHNYNRHFGLLKTLDEGAEVIVTDVAGHVFKYTVSVVEILEPTAVEEMTSGEWDLSLFTCTIGGKTRVTVRCALYNSLPDT